MRYFHILLLALQDKSSYCNWKTNQDVWNFKNK